LVEARVHRRLAEPLQVQLAQARELVEQARECLERHEREWPVRRTVAPELDGAHLAAQVALADRLDLHELRQRRRRHELRTRRDVRAHTNHTR